MQVSPSINEIAFNCPHCGAYTSQKWWQLFAEPLKNNEAPAPPGEDWLKKIDEDTALSAEAKERFCTYVKNIHSGLVFLESTENPCYSQTRAENLHLSECFVCKKISVWVHDRCCSHQPCRPTIQILICRKTFASIMRKQAASWAFHREGPQHCCASPYKSSAFT